MILELSLGYSKENRNLERELNFIFILGAATLNRNLSYPLIKLPGEFYVKSRFFKNDWLARLGFPRSSMVDKASLKGLSVEYEGGGCCISFNSSSFKELSHCYEKSWKSAAILLFTKVIYTLHHRQFLDIVMMRYEFFSVK